MNNEKQILKNQATILTALVDFKENDLETIKSIRERVEETKEVLFPKEEVPYEKSLEEGCGEDTEFYHGGLAGEPKVYWKCGEMMTSKIAFCKKCQSKFAKSSGGEGK